MLRPGSLAMPLYPGLGPVGSLTLARAQGWAPHVRRRARHSLKFVVLQALCVVLSMHYALSTKHVLHDYDTNVDMLIRCMILLPRKRCSLSSHFLAHQPHPPCCSTVPAMQLSTPLHPMAHKPPRKPFKSPYTSCKPIFYAWYGAEWG